VRTYHAFAMYPMENSIAVRRVVTRGAKTWKSRVSATIRHVHSPFEGMCLAVLLAWTPDKKIGGARTQLSVSLKDAVREGSVRSGPPREN